MGQLLNMEWVVIFVFRPIVLEIRPEAPWRNILLCRRWVSGLLANCRALSERRRPLRPSHPAARPASGFAGSLPFCPIVAPSNACFPSRQFAVGIGDVGLRAERFHEAVAAVRRPAACDPRSARDGAVEASCRPPRARSQRGAFRRGLDFSREAGYRRMGFPDGSRAGRCLS